jgi:hypothetical protein
MIHSSTMLIKILNKPNNNKYSLLHFSQKYKKFSHIREIEEEEVRAILGHKQYKEWKAGKRIEFIEVATEITYEKVFKKLNNKKKDGK